MKKNSAVAALKRTQQALSVTNDTYSLQDYVRDEGKKGVARLSIIGIEQKYLRKYDRRDAPEGSEGAGSLGFRTRFILSNEETIGTWSNAAHHFAAILIGILGYDPETEFLKVDFDGTIEVQVAVTDIGNNAYTYNFEMIEEESTFVGMTGLDQQALFTGQSKKVALGFGLTEAEDETQEDLPDSEQESQPTGEPISDQEALANETAANKAEAPKAKSDK